MKNIIQIFAMVVLFLGATAKSYAQLDWSTNGNTIGTTEWFGADNSSTIPVRYEHQTDGVVSRFEWYTTDGTLQERMRLTRAGWLGLNTTTPQMRFHVLNGGILSTGTTGTNPDLGAGTRLMWIPDQAAFRAGEVDGGQWDDTDVGNYSVAFGQNNLVSGDWSVAFSDGNEVTGNRSFAFGGSNTLAGSNAIGLGQSNEINSTGGVGIGVRNTIDGDFGIALGRFLHANAGNAIVIGRGVNGTTLLENPIQNSLMVGFNSALSTLFVGPPEGEEEFGSVGIGDVTDPTERLDVRGTARLRVMQEAETPDVVITGMEYDEEEGDYVLHYSNLDNVQDCTWDKVNGDQDLATGFTGACVEGNVLIGTDQPSVLYKVHMVNADHPRTLSVQSIGSESQQYGALFSAEGGTAISSAIIAIANDSPNNIGISSSASGSQSGSNEGVRGTASGGSNWNRGIVGVGNRGSNLNFGVYGEAYQAGESNPRQQVGVYGSAYNYSLFDNFGGYFNACDSENNIGVYATVCGETGGVAGYFTGAVLDTQAPISLSDETIKTQITEMENPLEIINQLQPKEYCF